MNFKISIILVTLALTFFSYNQVQNKKGKSDFPVLKGPYPGQKPPGMTPEIFAPSIVSTDLSEFGITISPDGKEILFTRTFMNPRKHVIMYCKYENNKWTIPKEVDFSSEFSQAEPNFSPDGKKLFFSEIQKDTDGNSISIIVVIEKTFSGWGKPAVLFPGMFATTTLKGTLYFTDVSAGEKKGDIVRRSFNEKEYSEQEILSNKKNQIYQDAHPFVSPEEDFIIFDSNRPGGFGESDLYIYYFGANNSLSDAINLGESINSEGYEAIPFIFLNGKILFFCKDGDIYWVDAKIIEQFRPKEI